MTADNSMMMVELHVPTKLDTSEKSKSSGGVDDSISERMKEVLHDDESASRSDSIVFKSLFLQMSHNV